MAAGSSSGGSEGIKAGRAYVEIGAKDAGLKAGLAAAKKAVLTVGLELAAAGASVFALGSAITAPILHSLKEVVEHFSEINRAAIRTGATTEAISDLGYAAKLSGSSLEGVESGLKILDKNLVAAENGSEEAKDALAAFGLTVEDLKGKDAREKFQAISEGLQGIEESARGPALRALLGRGALSLRPMLENSAELARLLKENAEVGGQVSKEDAENAERLEKTYLKVSAAIKNAYMAIGAAILPHADTIEKFAGGLANAIAQVKRFIDENRGAVVAVLGVGAALLAAGGAIIGLGLAVTAAGVAFGGLVTLAGAAGSALAVIFSPAGLAVAAVVVATLVAIAALLEAFPNEFAAAAEAGEHAWGGLAETFRMTWQGIKDALSQGDLKLAFQITLDGLAVVWRAFLLGVQIAWAQCAESIGSIWFKVITEIRVAMSSATREIIEDLRPILNKLPEAQLSRLAAAAGPWGALILRAGAADAGKTEAQIRADLAAQENVFKGLIGASVALRVFDMLGAVNKLAEDAAKAKPPPVEAGPMPREVARKAAVEGLGAVRGQLGGYGASFALATSGEAIARKQLTQLEEINENTKDGGGVKGW